ncbi:MAG: hypothetical protein JEZ03_16760 [Bacteroidales bacterium]|nr:hypothetical protein [Bacteroidales bacterium]
MEYAEYYTAANAFTEARNGVDEDYRRIRKFARFIFAKNNAAWMDLQLGEEISLPYAEWRKHVLHFFTALLNNEAYLTAMAPFGYTLENLTSEKASVEDLENLYQSREGEVGDAQRATKLRDTKFEELTAFCKELRELLKLIFEDDDAQILENLGILVRS